MRALTVKEVVKFYVGSKFQWTDDNGNSEIFWLQFVDVENDIFGWPDIEGNDIINGKWDDRTMKLILCDPLDMPQKEREEYKNLCHLNKFQEMDWRTDSPASLIYLFEKSIDCFDFIPRGLALNINAGSKISSKEELKEIEPAFENIIETKLTTCPICNGKGSRLDAKTKIERPCVGCNGLGVLKKKII